MTCDISTRMIGLLTGLYSITERSMQLGVCGVWERNIQLLSCEYRNEAEVCPRIILF